MHWLQKSIFLWASDCYTVQLFPFSCFGLIDEFVILWCLHCPSLKFSAVIPPLLYRVLCCSIHLHVSRIWHFNGGWIGDMCPKQIVRIFPYPKELVYYALSSTPNFWKIEPDDPMLYELCFTSCSVQLILIRLTCLINAVRSLVRLEWLFLLFLAGCWLLRYLQGCEIEAAEAEKGSSDELKSECEMKLLWALVHSKTPEDVLRGIAMLDRGKIDVAVSIPPCMQIVGHLCLFKLENDIHLWCLLLLVS